MRKSFTLLAAALMLASGTQASAIDLTSPIQMLRFDKQQRTVRPAIKRFTAANTEPGGTIKQAEDFGTLAAEDGTTWFYTVSTSPSPVSDYNIGGAEIRLYDSSNHEVTQVSVQIPDSMAVNAVQPFSSLSSKFFDTNSKTQEFMVYLHEIGPNYTSIGHFLIYNTQGELVRQYDNLDNILWFDATEKWETYQRAIFVSSGQDSEGKATTLMSIMKPCGWNSAEPTVEHHFELRDELIEYSGGPCLNTYKIDGQPYYVLSYYEQPYTQGWDENYEIILTEGNNFHIEVYDKQYERVTDFQLPASHPDDVYCSMYAMGLYSYKDLTRGYYSGDDQLNIVITRNDVRLDTDDDTYPYAFLVYDQQGNLINTIAENVIDWKQLTAIHGESDQVGCICLNDESETLQIINLPSCETAVTFQANVNERKISSNFDRYPVAGGDYQYVIGMGDATEGEKGEVIASIGWFHRDGTLDHYVNFDLGISGEYFTPLIEDYTLDPALFDTSSSHEYIYIAKMRRTDGSEAIDNILLVADAEGQELARFCGDDVSSLRVAAIVDYDTPQPRLVVGFYDEETLTYDVDFYPLPFTRFAQGGTGTKADPYRIATPGDLRQMQREPQACYMMVADIDMAETAEPWTPIPLFTGSLDGNGHSLQNLYIESRESYVGLASTISSEARIRRIELRRPHLHLTSGNRYAGLLAGMTIQASMDSIFCFDALIDGEAGVTTETGSLVGQCTYYSSLNACAMVNLNIDLPSASNLGGLVSDARTSTTVNASYVSGSISGRSTVGGIVGTTGKGCTVTDCHVTADLCAQSTIGGIIASAGRYEVKHNIMEGRICALATEGNINVGGIIGQIESDWTTSKSIIVSENVLNAADALQFATGAQAAHRIVGFTIADEPYDEGETPRIDPGLAANYALSTIAAMGEPGDTTPDGADFTLCDQAFLSGLNFAFGHTADAPWLLDDEGKPHLYFEDWSTSGLGTIQAESASDATGNATAIYNLSGQPATASHRGLRVCNGHIILVK